MDVALVIAIVAIPLLILQISRGRIHIRGGIASRETNPPLFWFVVCIEIAALAVFLVMIAIYIK